MSLKLTLLTTARVLNQIRHDPRTIAVMLIVPSALLTLLRLIFADRVDIFDQVGLMTLGIFPFITMFLVTSVAMVRERIGGTLERLLSTPLHKLDLIFGYAIAFALLAVVQVSVAATVAFLLLGLESQGSILTVLLVVVATAVLGCATGLLTSAFAQTEFQALQFFPAVGVPQLLLCGLIWPREDMSPALRALSNVVPLRYAAGALAEIGTYPLPTATMWEDLCAVVGFVVALLVAGALTLRRRSK